MLDVAAGNFHASLAAARRWCDVTTTDHASDLAQRSRAARSRPSPWACVSSMGMSKALPFADQSFDAVMSAFGAMFAVDQERAASEMIRVCRRGRQVGLANWTPDGFVGQLFRTVGRACAASSRRIATCALGHRRRASRNCSAPTANLWLTRKQVALPQPHAHGLGRQVARQLSSRAQGVSRCSTPTGSAHCARTCWSWWRSSIAPRTARWWWMRPTSRS